MDGREEGDLISVAERVFGGLVINAHAGQRASPERSHLGVALTDDVLKLAKGRLRGDFKIRLVTAGDVLEVRPEMDVDDHERRKGVWLRPTRVT